MPTAIGIGFSRDPDGLTAAQIAVKEAKRQIDEGAIDIALVYHTAHYHPKDFLNFLYESVDQTRLVGSSTTALILPHGIEDKGIGVMLLRSDHVKFEVGHMPHLHFQDIFEAGQKMASESITSYGAQFRKFCLFFVNGLNPFIPTFIRGLKDQLGEAFPIYGLGSSDDLLFKRTYQLYQNKYYTDGAVGLIIGGNMHFAISQKHGWKPLGKPRIIDSVRDNNHVIEKIDRQPAQNLLSHFFGEQAQRINDYRLGQINVRYPLGVTEPPEGQYLIRNITNTLDDGSIVCQDNVDAKSQVHVMLGSQHTCLKATAEALGEIKIQLAGKKPALIFIFESLMRYQLLQRSRNKEITLIKKALGDAVPIFGMFCTNEIFTPRFHVQEQAPTLVQNGSIIIAVIH